LTDQGTCHPNKNIVKQNVAQTSEDTLK
jgi:hypothetical protein